MAYPGSIPARVLQMHIPAVLLSYFCIVGASLTQKKNDRQNQERLDFIELYNSFEDIEKPSKYEIPPVYECKGVVGKGTFGTVELYENKDDSSDAIAVKSVEIPFFKKSSYNRLMNEVRLLKAMCHPNILKLLMAYRDDDTAPYPMMVLVTEYCSGGSLSRYHHRSPLKLTLTPELLVNVIEDILSALLYIHERGFIHRDVKPDNIMMTPSGAKLIDFGLSTVPQEKPTTCSEVLGSALFMPPEALAGKPYDDTFDIWSLGMSLWYLFGPPYPTAKPFKSRRDMSDLIQLYGGPWGDKTILPLLVQRFVNTALIFNRQSRPNAAKMSSIPWDKLK